MTAMTLAEKQAFLLGPHVATIAIEGADDGPLAVPIWYVYDQASNRISVITDRDSIKGELLSQGGNVGLLAQVDEAPYQYVSIRGVVNQVAATIGSELSAMATRYLGDTAGREYASQMNHSEMVTVDIEPIRWLGMDGSKRVLGSE